MFSRLLAKLESLFSTSFGHALEHAITASATTALGLLVTAFFLNGHQLHASDFSVAYASFVSGVLFFIRTWLRNRLP